MDLDIIQSKIYELRGQRVMLDFDLASIYQVETRTLKQAVRRNIERFEGEDFMFELTVEEYNRLKDSIRSQFVMLETDVRGRFPKYPPFAFTEIGVAMLSSVEDMGSFADRITTSSASDALLGDCIHQLMCIYCGQADFASIAADLAQQYGITIDGEALAQSVSKFYGRMQEIYGAPDSVEREVPFAFERANGEVVHGEIDMVYRTQEGDVVVDYKTYQGQSANLVDSQCKFYAGKYSGQVEIYEEALRREGRAVRDRVICYISLGRIIRLRFDAEQ